MDKLEEPRRCWIKRWVVPGLLPIAFVLYLAWTSTRSDLVIRDTAFKRTENGVVVRGTLVNRTARPIPSLPIEVRFFNASHEPIGEVSTIVRAVPPGGTVPFATEEVPLPNAAHYQVTLPVLRTPYGN